MIEQVREIFELLIAPQFESIRGDIRSIDTKVEGLRCELLAEIRRVESALSTDMVRLKEQFDTRLISMNEKIDSHRRELLAEIKAAAK
jgi:hypothetical protein